MNKQNVLFGSLAGLVAGANAGKIIRGVGCGFMAVVLAFGLIIYTVGGVEEKSVAVADLPLQSARDLDTAERGEVKVYGNLKADETLEIMAESCGGVDCAERSEALNEDNLVYFEVVYQRFEVVREVKQSEESNGDTTETVSYDHKWVTKNRDSQWTEVSLEGIKLDPESARTIINFEKEQIENAYIKDLPPVENYGRTPKEDEPDFGTTRATVTYLPLDEREYIVVGENRSSGITSGNPYIITDKSDSALVDQLGGEETTLRWGLRFVAFLMLTFGFTSILSPILVFTDLIPVAGDIARGLATFVSALLSLAIVLATVFLLSYWWLIAILVVLVVIVFMVVSGQRKSQSIN